MADWATMKPWKVVTRVPITSFNRNQILDAASFVKSYIGTNHQLPDSVDISTMQVSMPQFLELLTTVLLQINSGNNDTTDLWNFTYPQSPKDNIHTGNILKTEYLKLASDIKSYMDSSGKTPDYAYETSMGKYFGFENLVYMYSMILDYYNTSGKMADWIAVDPLEMHGYWMWSSDAYNFNPWSLRDSGITDIFFLTKSISGNLYYQQLHDVINLCKGPGIHVHAWLVCFKDTSASSWVDPAVSANRDKLINIINYLVTDQQFSGLKGIHLDYVRYSGVGDHAASAQPGGTSAAVNTITGFIHNVYDLVKSINPQIAVSAAVMPEGSANPDLYGQNYGQIADYIDFFTPMTYEGNYNANNAWITSATRYIVNQSKGKPVYTGLTTYWSDTDTRALNSSELDADVNSARIGGASGYVLFRYGGGTSYIPPWS